MTKSKWRKYATITTVSAMTIQLAACGTPGSDIEEVIADNRRVENESGEALRDTELVNTTSENEAEAIETTSNEDVIYEVPDDMTPEEYANYLLEEGTENVFDTDFAKACEEWEEWDDGSFQCIDEDSELYSQHFFNGIMYSTMAALLASSVYKNMNRQDGEKRTQIINSATVSPTNQKTSTNRSGSMPKGAKSSSSSKGSYSSGKSGFSSGGAARGGSASS